MCSSDLKDAELENIKKVVVNLQTIKAYKLKIDVYSQYDTLKIIMHDTLMFSYAPFVDLKFSYICYSLRNFTKKYNNISLYNIVYRDTNYLTKVSGPVYYKNFTKLEANTFVNNAFIQNPTFLGISEYILNNVSALEFEELDKENISNSRNLIGYNYNGSFTDLLFEFVLNCDNSNFDSLSYKSLRMMGLIANVDTSNEQIDLINYVMSECDKPKIDPLEPSPFRPTNEYLEFLRYNKN